MVDYRDGKCQCPSGKSALGETVNADVTCGDCANESVPSNDTKECACKTNYKPDWTKAGKADACKTKIEDNMEWDTDKGVCKNNWIGAKCDIECTWANMKESTNKTTALERTKCECKEKFFGDKCETDCTNAKYAGTYENKKCKCADKYFRENDKDATDCA